MYLRRISYISTVFTNLVEQVQSGCAAPCMEDLHSTTRYVSWSLHTRYTRWGAHFKAACGTMHPFACSGYLITIITQR